MAFGLSVKKITPMCAMKETTYGTRPTILPQTHGFVTMASPNPVRPEMNFETPDYQQSTWTPNKVIPTNRALPFNFSVPLMGGQAAGADSPPRCNGILVACGLKETVTASTSVVYKQALPSEIESATLAAQLGGFSAAGWTHEINGAYSNMRIRMPWKGMPMIDFTGRGLFRAPAAGALHTVLGGTAWAGGPTVANKFALTSTNRLSINNGAGAYTVVGKEVIFDLGIKFEDVGDFNSGATGNILRQAFTDSSEPRLILTIALDTDASALASYKDLYDDADDGTTHNVTWKYTDLAGKTILFAFAACQVLTVEPDLDGDHRIARITYKPVDATNPYVMTYAN